LAGKSNRDFGASLGNVEALLAPPNGGFAFCDLGEEFCGQLRKRDWTRGKGVAPLLVRALHENGEAGLLRDPDFQLVLRLGTQGSACRRSLVCGKGSLLLQFRRCVQNRRFGASSARFLAVSQWKFICTPMTNDSIQSAAEKPQLAVTALSVLLAGTDEERVPGRARGLYAPVQVHHDLESVRFRVETNPPDAVVTLNGESFSAGQPSPPFSLQPGRNVFAGTARLPGGCDISFACKIFRACPHLGWECVSPSVSWTPRDTAGELVFGGRMWIFGGYTPHLARDVWSSVDGVEWNCEGEIPTEIGIDIPVAFVLGGKMWVSDLDGVLFCSEDGKSWSEVTPAAPWKGRRSAGGVVFQDRVWVMGGASTQGELFNDVWSSTDGIQWRQELRHAPWCGRMIHAAPLVLDGKLWLLGGGVARGNYHPFIAWNDVWSSADGRNWERVLDRAPWPARIWGSAVVYRDRMWLLGGFRSEPAWENLGDIWFSRDGIVWEQLTPPPTLSHSGTANSALVLDRSRWERRHEHSLWAFHDSLWLAGGMVWPLKNDVWRLTIPGLSFLTQPPVEAFRGVLYQYTAKADFHLAKQEVQYGFLNAPKWLTLDSHTGAVEGVPDEVGDFRISISASADTERKVQEFTLHVLDPSQDRIL